MQKVLVFGYGPMLNQESARKILRDVDKLVATTSLYVTEH